MDGREPGLETHPTEQSPIEHASKVPRCTAFLCETLFMSKPHSVFASKSYVLRSIQSLQTKMFARQFVEVA